MQDTQLAVSAKVTRAGTSAGAHQVPAVRAASIAVGVWIALASAALAGPTTTGTGPTTTSTSTTTTTGVPTTTTTAVATTTTSTTTTSTTTTSTTTTTTLPSVMGPHPFLDKSTGDANTSVMNVDTELGQVCLAGQVREVAEGSVFTPDVTFFYTSIGNITKATDQKVEAEFVSVSLTLDISDSNEAYVPYNQKIVAECTLEARLQKVGIQDRVRLRCDLGENFSAFSGLTSEYIVAIDNAFAKGKRARAKSKNGKLTIKHVGEPTQDVGYSCDLSD